ncbi:hypothetical protein TNIN_446241 [Trichonephila inaurata madagascariensis]|uniref:Uncharacterized protein n=1 Tax=Trichonephila inaurata madagascariensis TaxID=2747483 RepID=A0A8X6YXX6_9ARAC|nr:hypothetical protein TNIN_446241 [Trichonephila inaurata madagascariensis]
MTRENKVPIKMDTPFPLGITMMPLVSSPVFDILDSSSNRILKGTENEFRNLTVALKVVFPVIRGVIELEGEFYGIQKHPKQSSVDFVYSKFKPGSVRGNNSAAY